jgi:hypothetical protein
VKQAIGMKPAQVFVAMPQNYRFAHWRYPPTIFSFPVSGRFPDPEICQNLENWKPCQSE